ncbi:MAG: EAL domain-containing protein [Curvibacter sp.]|nr:EAL domain-containing protein [Curvibacter sp.]
MSVAIPSDPTDKLRVSWRHPGPWLISVLVFALALAVGVWSIQQLERNAMQEARARAHNAAFASAHAIEERLGRSLSATYALSAVIAQGKGHIDRFEPLCQQMLHAYGGISNLQIAPHGIVSDIVPLTGNEKAIGHNLLEDTTRNKEARLAMQTRQLTLAGPFELIQGGMAVVGRLPVFLPDASGESHFWGFTIALIRIQDLLESSRLSHLSEQGYRYLLWRVHPDTGQRQVIAGEGGGLQNQTIETRIDVPNGQWTLSVEPLHGWYPEQAHALGLAAATLAALLLAGLTYQLLQSPIRLRREVATRTHELSQANLNLAMEVELSKEREKQLNLAASVFTHAREAISITDARGQVVEINQAFTRITGYARDEVLGRNIRILQSGRQGKAFYEAMWQALTTAGHWSGEIWNRRKDGEIYAEMLTISAVRSASGEVANYVGLFTDITTMKEQQQQLEKIAHFDPLTGLPNRVLLAELMQQSMGQALQQRTTLAVVYLDLDGFKSINDRHGHAVGDEVLVKIATRLKAGLREKDILARIGGDEFVAVLVDFESGKDYEPILSRLLESASMPCLLGGEWLQVSASIGMTLFPQDRVDADQLMRHADQAMYVAKQNGKNRYHLFDVLEDEAIKSHRAIQDRIRAALEQGELELYYQPKVAMDTGVVFGAEALLRWNHPDQGLLSPQAFLPAIDNHPLSAEVGEWVIENALRQLQQWNEQGLQLSVSVNISAHHLQSAHFVSRLADILGRYPAVDPVHLELEILESSALQDLQQVSSVMQSCRELGVRFALDDFGTGYSSLSYLKHLPVDVLKIDQSFVRDMLDDSTDLAIVKGVIGLAAAFQRAIIAEGVETAEQGQALISLGCPSAQGYRIAKPMPAAVFLDWKRQWHPPAGWSAAPAHASPSASFPAGPAHPS